MSEDIHDAENNLSEIEKELSGIAKRRHISEFGGGIQYSSRLRVTRYGGKAWGKTECHKDSGTEGRQDAERLDVLVASVALIAELPGDGEPRERFLDGLLAYLRAIDSTSLQIYPEDREFRIARPARDYVVAAYLRANPIVSGHSVEILDIARAARDYVRFLQNQALESAAGEHHANVTAENPAIDDPLTIRGKSGALRRSNEGYCAFSHVTSDGVPSQFTLNETEGRIVEKLWLARKDGTTTVTKSALLKAAQKDARSSTQYENVSKAFSKSGKSFYKAFIRNDNRGNYSLDLEKI
jgi:hypothetical protein